MIEVRRIRTSDDELRILIASYISQKTQTDTQRAAPCTIFDMSYKNEDQAVLKVSDQLSDGQQIALEMNEDEVIGSFVNYCFESGIPICRSSQKSVSRIAGGVAFDMVIRDLAAKPKPSRKDNTECLFVHDQCLSETPTNKTG